MNSRIASCVENRKSIKFLCLSIAIFLFSPSVSAQYAMEFGQTYNAPMSNFISNTFLNQQTLISAITPNKAQVRKSAPSFPLASPQVERSAAELAEALPAQHRARMGKVYADTMPGYHLIEHKLGWPNDDLAGAITALIAGNYMAMTGSEVSDAAVKTARAQLRNSASVQDMLNRLSPTDRRKLYEQCAMLGTFMTLANRTASQQPTKIIANFRESARLNLRAVLGASGDRLVINENGMQFR